MNKKIIIAIIALIVVGLGALAVSQKISKKSVVRNLGGISESECAAHHGEMIEKGCGIARCFYECIVPFKDGGKNCTKSSDCSGRCLVDYPGLSYNIDRSAARTGVFSKCKLEDEKNMAFDCRALNLKGKCQKNEFKNCESAWEFDGGKVKSIFIGCTL